MSKLVATFQERFGDWLTALGQHLQLSLLTLLLAIFLAVPLAIYLSTRKRASNWVLQVAGIFQTIPSMALLGLFIPIMGIGTLPALTALVIYAIFPILQNTITGLQGIDPSLEEAGIAFGMTKLERLEEVRDSLGHARYHVWDSDSSCDDYRDGYPSCLDWSRGTRFLYPSRN
jgi:ABC transporter membrane-spanning permease